MTSEVHIPTHGFFLLLAALFARWLCHRKLAQAEQFHLDAAVPVMVLGATLGARAAYLISRPYTWSEPGQWLKFWQGGMVSYGGLGGSLLALYLYRRRRGLSTLLLLDQIAPSLLLAWAVGRLGCFLNWHGEGGTPSDLPWAVQIGGESFHPAMLYTTLLLSSAALVLDRSKIEGLGARAALTLIGYSTVRIICDTWRDYEAAYILDLSRLVCVLLLKLGLALLHSSRRIPPSHVESVSQEDTP